HSSPCLPQRMPPSRLFGSVRRAIFASLSIVVALILLPPIALANPPDPSWVFGIYDGADGDDIVTLVCENIPANVLVCVHIAPLLCLRGISRENFAHHLHFSLCTCGSRAPPVPDLIVPQHVLNASPRRQRCLGSGPRPITDVSIARLWLSESPPQSTLDL